MTVKIITHGDADGLCAGALAYARYPEAEVWFSHPAGLMHDIEDVDADTVVICDIAISERHKERILPQFSRISKAGELIYIDHHPLPLKTVSGDLPGTKVIIDNSKSSSELAYRYFERDLPPDMNRVALFGAISDYCDETDFISSELDIFDKRTIYLESGLLSQCLAETMGDPNFKRSIVFQLADGYMPSAIKGIVERAMRSTKKEWEVYKYVQKKVEVTDGIALIRNVPKGVSPTKVAKFCLGVSGKNIGMGIRYKKKFADLGVRKRSDFPLDINQVLRTIAPRYGGTGGGHPNAGGARVLRESLDEFLTALSKEVSAII